MYLDGLDELDQKIIRLLIENARISYSDIGEETGISRVAVKARIQALEKRGVIEEYTTIINPQKISGAVSCYFEIETKPNNLSQVTDILYKNDTVTQIYRVTGRDKLHVHAVASSSDEMEHFLHNVIDGLPGSFRSIHCFFIQSLQAGYYPLHNITVHQTVHEKHSCIPFSDLQFSFQQVKAFIYRNLTLDLPQQIFIFTHKKTSHLFP